MDVLTDALRSLQSHTEVYGRLDLSAPWGVKLDFGERATGGGFFHAVARGGCWIEIERKQLALAPGDWVFILGATPHVLRDSPKTRARPLGDVYAEQGANCGGVLRHGGGGLQTTLVSFSFGFVGGWLNPVLATLPRLLHVKADSVLSTRWVESTVQLLSSEMETGRPGHEIVATRLADVLFIHALRTYTAALPNEAGGWLRALEDPHLGLALQRVHERPADQWTVEAMAKAAGMSRSTFAERFHEVIGEGPSAYVTRWRMHTAMQLMSDSNRSLSAIAEAVGYETEGAFGKAFRRHVGRTPGAFRRQLRDRSELPVSRHG
jgi:AraC-like DNA-binding protein